MNNEQLWRAVLGNLELNLSKPKFTTWFKNTSILKSGENNLTIGVPNGFTKEWLQNKYHSYIIQAIRAINPEIREVKYEIGNPSPQVEEAAPEQPPQEVQNTVKIEENVEKEAYFSPQPRDRGGINAKFRFETFVVGRTNELAHAASLGIAQKPGLVYNPLFIYGGVGLGKTHLMHAVGNRILETWPDKKVLYVSSERFTNEFIMAVKDGKAYEFKDRYRNVDALLIDDIQLLAGKEQTQEEFFHTFNALQSQNKQIIITSDRLPKEIPSIEDRLVSRFEGGMIADIQMPDYETREAILNGKIKEKGYQISPEIVSFIASRVESNIRELEGALNRVMVYCQMNSEPPTLDKVKEILTSIISQPKKRGLTAKKIMVAVAGYYGVTTEDLVKQSRKKEYVKPRQIAMFLIRKELETSLPSIGEIFGGRDHTTVIHAIDKVERITKDDENLKQELVLIVDKACI